jgi:geranylgeranyl transferase type-2 subunit alpha
LATIHEALNVGPEDQSLWYYHQFLILNLTGQKPSLAITPRLTQADRIKYLAEEIDFTKDLLVDYDDIKWLYEVLLEYTLSLCKLQGRKLDDKESNDLKTWLLKLRKLDPMRKTRWDDEEKAIDNF